MKATRSLELQRLLRDVAGSEILGEAEENCDRHLVRLSVSYVCDAVAKGHRLEVVAALLRLLATYEDGFCAVRGSEDRDLTPPSKLAFRFTSYDKRRAFTRSAKLYLNEDVYNCLSFTGPRPPKQARTG